MDLPPVFTCEHPWGVTGPPSTDPEVRVVDGLCIDDEALGVTLGEDPPRRFVLGVCRRGSSTTEVRAQIRRARADPLLAEVVDLREFEDSPDDARKVLQSRALALARRSAPRPEQLRMRLATEGVTRRSLFRLGGVTYEPVAAITAEACKGTQRCGVCIAACPVDAIVPGEPTPVVTKEACLGCGACVTLCPSRAIDLPAASLVSAETEVAHLASGEDVAFVCRSARAAEPDRMGGALPIDVPCLAQVGTGWILQTLAAGARSVKLVGCGDACRVDGADGAQGRVAFAQDVLAAIGDDRDKVRFTVASTMTTEPRADHAVVEPILVPDTSTRLDEPVATVTAVRILAAERSVHAAEPIPGGPVGSVAIDATGCTLCGSCVIACPTRALSLDEGPIASTLTFDPAHCVGCRHCEEVCPEDVIVVTDGIRLDGLEARQAASGAMGRCRSCGEPVAPAAMLAKVRELLGEDNPDLLTATTDLCSSCRGVAR